MTDAAMNALRMGVAWTTDPPTVCLRIGGQDAFSTLDRVCPADLFVRDGQVRPTVLLNEQGQVFADVYIGQDDDAYLLISEGPSAEVLVEHVRAHATSGSDLTIEDLTASHGLVSVQGPYAWELIGEVLGPDLIGLPYLYFYRTNDILCLRGGKTGEYGYDLFVPQAAIADLQARLLDRGAPFNLERVGLPTLEQAALENGFFNVRREGKHNLTPMELGILWRVSYRKEYVGSQAVLEERARGPMRRATTLMSELPVVEGDPVFWSDVVIGSVVSAGYSSTANAHVAIAVLDKPYYHAGIEEYTAGAERVNVTTVSPPVLVNRSLYINPQRHTFATRGRDNFPPIYE